MLTGICANARNSWPSAADFDDLKPQAIRTIVYDNDELDAALQDTPPGVAVFAVMNNEHRDVGSDWSGWAQAVERFASRFAGRVYAVECGNESDLHGIPADVACARTNAALGPLQDAGILCLHGSVAGPDWQTYLAECAGLLDARVDGICLHPYGQRITIWSGRQPGFLPGMREAVVKASTITGGKRVYVTEFGAKIQDYAIHVDPSRQARYVTEAFAEIAASGVAEVGFYFAWRDGVGAPNEQGINAFGLSDNDGNHRPGWDALRAVSAPPGGTMPPPAPGVGPGLLAMMTEDGTTPAQRASTWLPLGVTPSDVEQCYGANGTLYVWLLTTGAGHRFIPRA